MKKISLFLLIIALGAKAALCAPVNEDVQTVAKNTNNFAYGLYGQIAKEGGNLFCSPYSISSALAMTYAGARGKTAEQMASVLGFTLPADKLNHALSELMKSFNAKDKAYQLLVANALWGQTGYAFDPAFIKVTKKYYGAGFKEVDYVNEVKREEARKEINAWTAKQTADKIQDLIGPKVLTEMTRLVLTNAIYFKGKWQFQFKKESTKDMPFAVSPAEKKPVPMMHQTTKFKYGEDANVQVLQMPYAGGDLSMVVILPKESYGIDKLQGELSTRIDGWLAAVSEQKVEVYLPRFKLETEFVLNDQLIALGMADAFDEAAADFSGMTPDPKGLFISKVIHKAFVDVNEEGTEAAAATAVVMATKSATFSMERPPVFRADRPFLFLIRDMRTGTILFIGRLTDPR
jgi:serpin B